MANRQKLTQHFVDALEGNGSDQKVWDTQVPGFHVRIHPSGRRTYAFYYRLRTGDQRNLTLGKVAEGVKLEAMRRKAREFLVAVQNGVDPSGERRLERKAQRMGELFEEYLDRHARPRKRPRSIAEDERNWRVHLAPRFSSMMIDKVSKRDLDAFMAEMSGKRGAANRCLALISKMMSLAVEWDYRPDNPCRKVERYAENQVEAFLTPQQATALFAALDEEQDRGAATAIELLFLTGARREEVLSASWEQFDLSDDNPIWTIPSETLKGHVRRRIDLRRPLSGEAADLLRRWRRQPGLSSLQWVFPSNRDVGKRRADLKDAWYRVRKVARLPTLRLHDLRHSFASAAINSGASLFAVGKALGHRDARTTQRYAHLSDQAVRDTAAAVGRFASRR
jgi:integrase